jgi:hypothetical protein
MVGVAMIMHARCLISGNRLPWRSGCIRLAVNAIAPYHARLAEPMAG